MDELFSPERLQFARQRRGMFAQELAARIGVAPRTVSTWENGKATPTEANIAALAAVLNFPKDFFYGDAPPALNAAVFRSLARMTARQRGMAVMAGAQAVALDHWIEQQFTRPDPNVPDLRDSDPEAAAEQVRALWGLGYSPINNLVHQLEKNGVRVYSLVHDGTEIDAFSVWQGSVPFIFLNTTKTAERSRMDAAHELAHLVLHAHTAGGAEKQHEVEAQAFASAFLMPKAPVIASAPRRVTLATILEAKARWGVSALAYVYRLYALRRLTEAQYRRLMIQIKSAYGITEPGESRPRETSQVLAKVFAPSPDGRTVKRTEVAKVLRIYTHDLDEMTFGLTLTPVTGGVRPANPTPFVGGGLRRVK